MAKITANEYVKVAWIPDALITPAQAAAPSATLLNNTATTLDLSPAIAWQDFELGASDSDDVEDRGITDPGNAVTRGFANFSATLSFFRDANSSDTNSDYVKAFSTFRTPRTYGYLVIRVAEKKWSAPWAAGDRISVYKFIADIIVDDTEGDDSVKFTVSYLPQGVMYPYTTVAAATPAAITNVSTTDSMVVGAKKVILPTLSGADVRAVSSYTSSNTNIVSVSANGVKTARAAGTANVTVTTPGSAAPVVQAVTVTAA